MNGHRKLLVAALNKLIDLNHVDPSASKSGINHDSDHRYIITKIWDENTMISWSDIGHQELRLTVWWKYDHDKHPQANSTGNSKEAFTTTRPLAKRHHYPEFVGVTVSAWVERKKGFHIQGYGQEHLQDVYTRRGEQDILDRLPTPIPNGFKDEGRFFM